MNMKKYEPFDEQMEKIINEHSKNYSDVYNKASQSTHIELLQQNGQFGFKTILFVVNRVLFLSIVILSPFYLQQ